MFVILFDKLFHSLMVYRKNEFWKTFSLAWISLYLILIVRCRIGSKALSMYLNPLVMSKSVFKQYNSLLNSSSFFVNWGDNTFFQSSGTFPCFNDALKSWTKASAITSAHFFKRRAVMSGLHAFWGSSFFNSLMMPFLVYFYMTFL